MSQRVKTHGTSEIGRTTITYDQDVAAGTKQAAIADPAAGSTVDAEARTAINSIIDSLEAFGIITPS